MSTTKKNQPIMRVSCHPVSAAIWRNENGGKAFYSATFERQYKDKDGKYQTSGNFSASDLLLLAKAADLAHTEILGRQERDRAGNADE